MLQMVFIKSGLKVNCANILICGKRSQISKDSTINKAYYYTYNASLGTLYYIILLLHATIKMTRLSKTQKRGLN